METRRRARNKRKAEEDTEMEFIQMKKLKKLDRGSDEVGPRDILISKGDQCSVCAEDTAIKQEIKIEVEDGAVNEEFGEQESSQVKFELEEQKIVVLNEAEIIRNDDDKNETGGSIESAKEQGPSKKLQIKSESQSEDVEHGQDQIVTLEEILPHIVDHLELKNILLCRVVSKKWRKVVDNFIHGKISDEPFENERYLSNMKRCPQLEESSEQKYWPVKYAYVFRNPNKINKFSKIMEKHCELQLSPFVGHAEVKLANSYHYTIFESLKVYKCSEEVRNFIQLFGKYITGLEIKGEYMMCTSLTFCFGQTIQMCLDRCPSLRTFSVRIDPYGGGDTIVCSFDNSSMFNGLRLPEHLNSFSLNMYLDCVPSLSDLVMNRLIQPFYNDKLLKLTIDWEEGFNLKMSQLRELTLRLPMWFLTLKTPCSVFERIFSGEWLEAPIEKFCFSSLNMNHSPYSKINYAHMLKMLGMFPTIRYLKLDYPISSATSFKNLVGFQSNNIHTLEIKYFYGDDKLPLDFLGAFPKLKYLRMCIVRYLDRDDYRVVKRGGNLHSTLKLMNARAISLYESELWKIAEDLERVVIQCHTHLCEVKIWGLNKFNLCSATHTCPITMIVGTREGYRQYCVRSATDN